MRALLAVLSLLCLLGGCNQPPQSAYIGGSSAQAKDAVSLGTDVSGESCNQLPPGSSGTVEVYCGTWQQPAARVRIAASGGLELATSGAWREALDKRFACNTPATTSSIDGAPAVLLQCTRRIGGWPQVALVTNINGRTYLADGITPALPVMQRAIAVLSGRTAATVAALPPSAADTLMANQLAAHAFSANDVGEYERLMALGARANLAESFATAETAYRAALVLQQRTLGRDDPDNVTALMHLALQVSDQGRSAEADTLFQQANKLVSKANDPVALARLTHYRALHALNQGRNDQALELLRRAGAEYATLLPVESLRPGGTQPPPTRQVAAVSSTSLASDPATQSALIGLIECRRYQAIVLRLLGRPSDSAAAIVSAEALANANRFTVPLVSARLTRTSATTADVQGNALLAETGLARSRQDFTQVVPQTRPVAETALLQASVSARQGDTTRAIQLCHTGTALLRELRSGTDPALLQPCLEAYASAASQRPGEQQALLSEMFETAELAQDSITSRQIDEAAARLAANARDPKVAEAIRRRQDAAVNLAELYRQRDALSGTAPVIGVQSNQATLDKDIVTAQAELADSDAALQTAAPNYGQLVQQVVPAADVLAALAPDEAFAAIMLTRSGGWVFLLRNGRISAEPLHADTAAITALVKRVRAGIELTTSGLPKFDTSAAQAIYDATLAPVAQQLSGAKSLIVAPSGALLSLPFAVLLTGPAESSHLAEAPWLLRQFTLAHVPSAANFVALRKAGVSRAQHPWFGFGGFRPVTLAQATASFPGATCADSAKLFASLPPLPFAQRELDVARALLGGQPSDELLNAAFTVDAVRRTGLKDYRVLHFATHALLPAELRCQDEPAIVTSAPAGAHNASGALLSASDIIGLDLDANAIILSACNSGGPGNSTSGESLSGLARAFFFAGARSMLVTHWSISDQSSAFLVADTLRRYVGGEEGGMAGALRAAQLGMISRAGKDLPADLAHPFYWAPFALIGEGRGKPATS